MNQNETEALELKLLLDVQMPGMDGFETARLIKGRKKTQEVPIVFITAFSQETNYVVQGYEAGAVDYIFKPFPYLMTSGPLAGHRRLCRYTEFRREEVDLSEAAAFVSREIQATQPERSVEWMIGKGLSGRKGRVVLLYPSPEIKRKTSENIFSLTPPTSTAAWPSPGRRSWNS